LATEVKPKSNRILLIFGFFLAIVAFGGALLVGRTGGGANSFTAGPKNVPAVVAVKDIPASTQITADLVTVQQYSADQAPPFAYRSKDVVVGKYAAIPIHAGSAIIDYDIVADQSGVQPAKQAFLPIPKGMVAMQIPTGELVGIGGNIQPDDLIDIIVSYNPKPTDPKSKIVTVTTFTNLKIIRVGPAGAANTRGITSSLTVIVSLQQAQELKWLLDNTNYKYVLRSVQDYPTPEVGTVATDIDQFNSTFHVR
jgi:Flp pilus assembly protein CpaB